MPTAEAVNQVSKRRACDACRSRKLACSKDVGGCSRCVRENVECIYSEQKPMGRPRKRQYNGEEKDNLTYSTLETNLSGDRNPYYENKEDDILFLSEDPNPLSSETGICAQDDGEFTIKNRDGAIWHYGHSEIDRPINFDLGNDDFPVADYQPGNTLSTSDRSDLGLSHSSTKDASMIQDYVPSPNPGLACSCLASMYLAMAALQDLPQEFSQALGTIRRACGTAHTSLRCEYCGTPLVTSPHPSIETFQNVMLLGTILPTIVDSYKRLLFMIDQETEMAKSIGIKKTFHLQKYGGVIGENTFCCEIMGQYENIDMEPDAWRSTVRALLRMDIYGEQGRFVGLSGLIEEMEARQRDRHRTLRESGLIDPVDEKNCTGDPDKDAFCIRILDVAKVSLQTLIIP